MKFKKPIILIIALILISGACFFGSQLRQNKNVVGASKELTKKIATNNVSTIIVPHHDLDKDNRSDLFAKVSPLNKAKTIILVSTNHFDTGNSNILTTPKKWNLSNGTISPNSEVVNGLVDAGIAKSHDNSFNDEHGIKNILPDIMKYYPQALVVPVIIKPGTKEEDLQKLGDKLVNSCKEDCLFVGSVDFSHYQPGSLSEIHDDLSIRALSNLDANLLARAEVDSKETLNLAMKWAKSNNTEQFNLFKNTNSGKIENNRDGESTSYVLGYYDKGSIVKKDDSFTFMVGGDMMFDRNIEYHFQGNKLVDVMKNFGNRVFAGVDLSLVNLEGPISPIPLVPESNHSMVFNFPPNTVNVLSYLGVNAVSLANNHTLNNGAKGLANTKKVLPENGIAYVGQDAVFNDESVKTFENGGHIKLSVITIDCLDTTTDITGVIKKQKNAGNLVLVYPHWGTEYEQTHNKSQEVLAHSWIDAGADFVFGGHPHVIQDAEVYKGKPIFYSLGNLLFDQDFSPETQRGLVVAVKISKESTELVLLPTLSKKYQPQLLSGSEKTAFLKKFRTFLGAQEIDPRYGYDKIDVH